MMDYCYIDKENRSIILFEQSRCALDEKDERLINELLMFIDQYEYAKKPFNIQLGRDSRYIIITSGFVGFATMNHYTVSVLPKIFSKKSWKTRNMIADATRALFRMIDIVYDFTRHIHLTLSEFEEAAYRGLHEIILYIYSQILLEELNRGIYREYYAFVNDEKFLRGKLNLTRQILKLPTKLHTFNIRYHRLSSNNLLNRVLYYAAYLGSKFTNWRNNRNRLNYILSLLDEAAVYSIHDIILDNVVFNRLNLRFERAYNLAKIIIRGFSKLYDRKAAGFFINMSNLFEEFIFSIIHKVLSDKYIVLYQYNAGKLLEIFWGKEYGLRSIKLRPDIAIIDRQTRKPIAFIDVKYKEIKIIEEPEIDTRDLHQMFSYSKALEKHTRKGSLIIMVYPYIKELFNEKIFSKNRAFEGSFVLDSEGEIGKGKLIIMGYDLTELLEKDFYKRMYCKDHEFFRKLKENINQY